MKLALKSVVFVLLLYPNQDAYSIQEREVPVGHDLVDSKVEGLHICQDRVKNHHRLNDRVACFRCPRLYVPRSREQLIFV